MLVFVLEQTLNMYVCVCVHAHASMVKWTKKTLRNTKTMMFLVKNLKLVAKCCLNWGFFSILIYVVVLYTQM